MEKALLDTHPEDPRPAPELDPDACFRADYTAAGAGFFCIIPLAWFLRNLLMTLKIPPLAANLVMQSLHLLVPAAALLACVKFLPGKSFLDALSLRKPEHFTIHAAGKSFILLYLLTLAAGWAARGVNEFFHFGWKAQGMLETGLSGPWSLFAVFAIGSILLAPVAEELLFRGAFYRVLERFLGGKEAALITSFLFAAIHWNMLAFAPLFVMGLFLQHEYRKNGSLLPCMLLHAAYNAAAFLLLFLSRVPGGSGAAGLF